MSSQNEESPDRRNLLQLGVLATLIGVTLAGSARSTPAKTPKSDVKYQFTPQGDGSRCGLCASFIPPADGGPGPGGCKIVDGPIPQSGWCVLFARR